MSVSEKYDKLFKKLAQRVNRKKAEKWRSPGKIFPSSAGVSCELKLRYDFTGADKSIDFIWHGCENIIGDAIHDYIQTNFKDAFGEKVEIEKYISLVVEGVKINGKVDIILEKNKIIEIKTVKATEGKEPDITHIKQVQWYMGVLGLNKAALCYINRENGIHINTFEIEFDERVFEKIKLKFARVIKGVKDLRSDTRECKYCPYKKICPSYKPVPRWVKK